MLFLINYWYHRFWRTFPRASSRSPFSLLYYYIFLSLFLAVMSMPMVVRCSLHKPLGWWFVSGGRLAQLASEPAGPECNIILGKWISLGRIMAVNIPWNRSIVNTDPHLLTGNQFKFLWVFICTNKLVCFVLLRQTTCLIILTNFFFFFKNMFQNSLFSKPLKYKI